MATEQTRPRIKSQLGMVVSDKMDKTVVVTVEHMTRHRLYQKTIRRTKRYLAHDDRLEARIGDKVRIVETRPLSRNKRWRVAEIVEKGEGAEIAPREIDSQYIGKHRERKPADEAAATEGTTMAEGPATEEPTTEPVTAADEPLSTDLLSTDAEPGEGQADS